jgi:monoamine oxidase
MIDNFSDVLILGAGVAGLSAARDLSRAGLSVGVLEARDRIGGRIWTLHDPAVSLPVELGAEFIHGRPADTWEIVRAAGLAVYEDTGQGWVATGGVLRPNDGWQDADELFARMAQVGPEDQTFGAFVAPYLRDERWREAAQLATSYVEGFDAAPADRASVLALVREQATADNIGGDRSFHVLGGYDTIARVLHAEFAPGRAAVRLGALATAVEWSPGAVSVTAVSAQGVPLGPFRARQLIVTLPLGVLRAPAGERGHVSFTPALPHKEQVAGRLEMGHVIKIVLRFRERFWEDAELVRQPPGDNLEQLGFLFARGAPLPTWWAPYPLIAPVLTGWAGGPAAARLALRGDDYVLGQALESLAEALHLAPARLKALLVSSHQHDWQADPLARGAYSYIPAGSLHAPDELAQPVADTLFFAGEATDITGRTGTVDGAIASGRRAAREVLEATAHSMPPAEGAA